MKQSIIRVFYPGDKWLFFKIYTGVNSSDKLLLELLFPLLKDWEKKKLCQKWFFIRFADPDFHIRLRILLTDKDLLGYCINALNKKMTTYKNIYTNKIEISTYRRELERYGAKCIELTETIFWIDSKCTLSLLNLINKLGLNANEKWLCAFRIVNDYLDLLGYATVQKLEIISRVDRQFLSEFGVGENVKRLNNSYRKYQNLIKLAMSQRVDESCFNGKILDLLNERYVLLKKYIELTKHSDLNVVAIIHMSLNRFFMSDNRCNELFIYRFLAKYYITLKKEHYG